MPVSPTQNYYFYFTTPIHSHLRGLYWAHQCSWILLRYLWKSTPFLESSSIEASTYVFEIPLFFLIFYQRIYITTSSLLFHTGQYFFLSRSRVLVLVTKNSITDVILPHKFIISRWWGRKKRETLSRKICATVSRYLGREWPSSQVPNIRMATTTSMTLGFDPQALKAILPYLGRYDRSEVLKILWKVRVCGQLKESLLVSIFSNR